MKLRRLEIARLPGIEQPLSLTDLSPGVNVVVGPNASGKSSLLRALLALVYPEEYPDQAQLEAELELPGDPPAVCLAVRLGDSVAWERAGLPAMAPPVPPHHLSGAYLLRVEDLLVEDQPARPALARGRRAKGDITLDRSIADSIVRELTGGVDLRRVRVELDTQKDKGRVLARELGDEATELQRLKAARADLSEREGRQAALAERRAAELSLASERHLFEDAIRLVEANRRLELANVRVAAHGEGYEQLHGNEAERLAELQEALDGRDRELEAARQDLAAEQRVLLATGLAEAGLTAEAAAQWVEKAESLKGAEQKLADARREEERGKEELRDALRRLGARSPGEVDPPAVDLGPGELERIESLLHTRLVARAESDALNLQLARLMAAEDDQPPADPADEEELRRARWLLYDWLQAPVFDRAGAPWVWGSALCFIAVVAAGTALAQAWLEQLPTWVATLALLTVTTAAFWLIVRPKPPRERNRLRQQLAEMPVTPPASWQEADVHQRITELDDDLLRLRRSLESETERKRQGDELAARLERARSDETKANAELDRVRSLSGYAPNLPEVALASWLQAVRDTDRLHRSLRGTVSVRKGSEALVTGLRAELVGYIRAHQVAVASSSDPGELPPQDGLALAAASREVARRVQERDGARHRLAAGRAAIERAESDLGRLRAQVGQLLEGAGLAAWDRPAAQVELLRRCQRKPEWDNDQRELLEAMTAARELERRLDGHETALEMARRADEEAIGEQLRKAEQASEEAERLAKQIGDTRRDIERAASDREIERAVLRSARAEERLLAHRDEAFQVAAAEFLLDQVEAEHRAASRPAALEAAAAWFVLFTNGHFELRFLPEDSFDRRLAAFDTRAGKARELSELSTGTRAQLLLASRVAFAIQSERGGAALPFFLDEALTTSDPGRFAQVAGAMLALARENGRQVFYLSARSDDAELWRRAAQASGDSVNVIEMPALGAATGMPVAG